MKRWTTWLWPALVGTAALAITGWLWQHERALEGRDLRRAFDFGLRQAANRVEQRMASFEQMLRGVRGLFDASDLVTPRDFDTYVGLLQTGPDFAGLRSIGWAPLRTDGAVPTAPSTFLAPQGGMPLTAPGADLLAHPVLGAAMLRARDAGHVVVTPLVRWPGTAAAAHPAADAADGTVLMFMPLYARGQPSATVAQRRSHGVGWVFAAFRMGELVSSLYGEGTPGLDLRLHDGAGIADATRLHPPLAATPDTGPARFDAQEYIGFAGHTWTVRARSTPGFEQPPGRDTAQVIAVAGGGLGVVLALLTWLLLTGRDRAHETARTMTRQLRDSERQYRRIVETASEGIWMVDAQGRTRFANPALQRQLGCGNEALLGRPWTDFMDDAGRAALASGVAPPTALQQEISLRRADGGALQASVSVSPILDEHGQPAGLLAMVTDVGERHRAEARRALLEGQLRQSQKMEAIGTLAGGIAHDFNNILAGILGNVALVQQDLAAQHPSQPRLGQIAQAGARARSLVQQIVAFSRRQPQALVVQPLGPLLDEAVKLLRAMLPSRVALQLQCPPQAVSMAADATQLQQVLMNLCTNAWHALTDGAGRITIGLDSVWLEASAAERLGGLAAGRHAHVWVADNGCGMDEATRQRIFEPFFTTKPVGAGTGLGLSVVHGIVAAHGGAITVASTPGGGSTFDLYFPQVQSQAGPATGGAPAADGGHPPQGAGQHVLYVDDDPVMLLMVQALLQRQGWRVSCAQDGQQALERALASDDPVQAVVTDFNMPGLSGLDLARALACHRPTLPLIISTGFIADSLLAEARRAGVRHVLQKEHTLDQLGRLLQQVLAAGDTPPTAGLARP